MANLESLELDEARMCAWGEALGADLRGGDVVLLRGPMGAGKTTLVRAIARGLGVARPDRVRSPTFAVCMIHAGPIELVHVDLFRLGEADSAPLSTIVSVRSTTSRSSMSWIGLPAGRTPPARWASRVLTSLMRASTSHSPSSRA